MTTTVTRDPFAGIRQRVPTRYAPGATGRPYDYPAADIWYPVIYFYAGEVVKGEGPIWLVEPYPAELADGTDGLDEVDSAGVAVLRGDAAPQPRGEDRDGDWVIPGKALRKNSAYDVHVGNQADLMAAWCEAHAIATALNNGLVQVLDLKPEDIEVLMAAERGDLTGDSRFAGTINELRWKLISVEDKAGNHQRVGTAQARRLRQRPIMIEPAATEQKRPSRPELSTSGLPWTVTTYRPTRAAAMILAEIRRQYAGPTRCRVCGCTEDRACPDRCSWIEPDLCSDPACAADDLERATR